MIPFKSESCQQPALPEIFEASRCLTKQNRQDALSTCRTRRTVVCRGPSHTDVRGLAAAAERCRHRLGSNGCWCARRRSSGTCTLGELSRESRAGHPQAHRARYGRRCQLALTSRQEMLFVLPVDDFDLAPAHCLELLRLIRMITTPRLVFVVAGNIRVAETVLRLKSEGDLSALAGTDAPRTSDLLERPAAMPAPLPQRPATPGQHPRPTPRTQTSAPQPQRR